MSDQKTKMHIDTSERRWIWASIVVLVIFAIAVSVAGFMLGIQVPTDERRVDPRTFQEELPWSEPGVRTIVEGEEYEVWMIATRFLFVPNTIEVPAGAKVTFHVTSTDVQHGFMLENTNVNFMVLPGQVSTLSATLDDPGEYTFICHEFCGLAHAAMFGTLTVTEGE